MNYLDQVALRVERELQDDLRPDARAEELYRVYALLVLVRGAECSLSDVHDAWSTWMAAERPEHPALVPFPALSSEAQEKDRPYLSAIHRVARDMIV
jgi:hypothetical protein